MPKQRRPRKGVKRRVKKRQRGGAITKRKGTKRRVKRRQRGGAALSSFHRGPSLQDKTAYGVSMFVDPMASWGSLGKMLAEQAFKGVTDNVEHYLS